MIRGKIGSRVVLDSITITIDDNGIVEIKLNTNLGPVDTRYHKSEGAEAAVIWVGGAGGGLVGPAGGLYPRIAEQLVAQNIASLRVDYRMPNEIQNCVIDTLIGAQFLTGERKHSRIALVGHSFGGAVVIYAGTLLPNVVAVAALSNQLYGTDLVHRLSPRSLLLIHGKNDEILSHYCSEDIYKRAHEPKKIILYSDCRHGLDECRGQLDNDLKNWLIENLIS